MMPVNVKCCVLGDRCVGKTCLVVRYTRNEYSEEYIPTVFDNYSTTLMCDGKIINLSLCDNSGQENDDLLRHLSWASTNIFLICYSIDSQASFDNIKKTWVPELKHYCKDIPYILVATKCDLRNNNNNNNNNKKNIQQLISTQDGFDLSKEIGAFDFVECSAKTMNNLNVVFDKAMRLALNPITTKKKDKSSCIIW